MTKFNVFTTNQEEINEMVNLVCMYYARLSSDNVTYKQAKSKDIELISDFFKLKRSTVNNYKDYYDALYENNGRKGWWQRTPESYPKLYATYKEYKDISIEDHAAIVADIIMNIKTPLSPYFSIKTKDAETVRKILEKSSSIIFSGINILQDKLKIGQPVFIVLGGDKPAWDTGLVGMGVISQEPFDIGYDRNNFKISVDIKLLLNKTIKRADLVKYKDAYDIIGIGPITKWEPNQALSQIESRKAIALMRAMLDLDSSILTDLSTLVTPELMQKIKAATPMYNEIMVEYGGRIHQTVTPQDTIPTIPQKDFSINSIIEHINETGLLYSPSLIKRFAFSLMAKRFLILSGLAGSGKTQLALAFAKALVEDKEKQMCVVSVGADWTNREPLLGYPNALRPGEYIKPENGVLDLLIEANKPQNASKPFFLILDEMNMSYVERYFADFLSAMESHEAIALWKECNNECESCECEVPERIGLPDNLFIIGTINVDETTYMFSPKVLDRANVIEFKISIDEMTEFLDGIRQVDCSSICSKAAEMGADFVKLANCKDFDNVEATTDTLKAFFTELKSVNAEFGYRSATEIFRFISQAHKNDDTAEKMSKEEVLDAAILQKLLPKLHGSRKKLEPALKGLWKLCFDPSIKDTMQIARENIDKAIYKESADKIFRMYESAYANGFTSFAEA